MMLFQEAPLVTVGVTAYDAADTLAAAVNSALGQSWRPVEIVAVDDASADDTWPVLLRLADAHPEVRVFRNETNLGVAGTRNRILQEARGEFVAFFDDDDVSAPHRVERQLQRITDYEERFAGGVPVVCHAARRVRYPDGEVRVEGTMGEREDRPAPSGPAVAARVLLGEPLEDGYGACPTCSQMARRSVYEQLGGFAPEFRRSEDTDFTVRLALAGGHFAGLAEPLVEQTMTRSGDKSLEREYHYLRLLYAKHREFVESRGSYDFCLGWLDAKRALQEGRRAQAGWLLAGLLLRYPARSVRRGLAAYRHLGLNRAYGTFHGGGA